MEVILMENRVYFVIDMKSFFASVECAERGFDPMTTRLVVADKERTEKTICLAVSPAMKALGVKNRCRLFQIPNNIDYIIAKPRMKKYIEYNVKIYGIYLKYIDKKDIHVYSIDECIIDVTDYLKLYNIKAKPFALKLIKEIKETVNIPATCGIGTNMYLAKVALGITAKKSKDGIGWLNEEKFKRELWFHKPLSDFWGISSGIENHLARLGIYDMHGIATYDEDILYKEFGINAEIIIDHSKGIEPVRMEDIKNYKNKSKSISQSQVLSRAYSYDEGIIILKEMINDGCLNLAKQHYVTNVVSIGLRIDNGYKHASSKLTVSTNLYSYIAEEAIKLYKKIVDKNDQIRGIGYSFSAIPESFEQYDLFSDTKIIDKEKKLRDSIIGIKDKLGKNSVIKAIDLDESATQIERNKMIGGHNSGED